MSNKQLKCWKQASVSRHYERHIVFVVKKTRPNEIDSERNVDTVLPRPSK